VNKEVLLTVAIKKNLHSMRGGCATHRKNFAAYIYVVIHMEKFTASL